MQTWARLGTLALVLAAGTAVAVFVPLPELDEIRAWAAAGGWWVPVVFVGGYALATVLPLPKNVLSIGAGLVFGIGLGAWLVWLAAMLGATMAFWLGRVLGRDGVRRLAGRHLDRVDGVLDRHGLSAVLVARLVPVVPFTAINYGSGVTGVGFGVYLAATAVGIVPGTVAYVAVGATGADPGGRPFILVAGALGALTIGGTLLARRRSRRAPAGLPVDGPDDREGEPPREPGTPGPPPDAEEAPC